MRMIAMSNSGAVVSTRAGSVLPSGRRMVTELLEPTTWTLVRIVSGATKKPLPKPPLDSTRTTAGIARPITSSSDDGVAKAGIGAETAEASTGTTMAGVTPASTSGDGDATSTASAVGAIASTGAGAAGLATAAA